MPTGLILLQHTSSVLIDCRPYVIHDVIPSLALQPQTDMMLLPKQHLSIAAHLLCVRSLLACSLAIMTDAAHLLSDVGGFGVSIFAAYYASKRSQQSHTFG